MITVKKSQIRRKENKDRSNLIKRFSAMNIDQSKLPSQLPVGPMSIEPIKPIEPIEPTVDKWIVPIYTKTYCDHTDPSSIPLQQTSVYSYFGRELIQVKIPEEIDLKLFFFERFGLSPDDKYKIHQYGNIIFIYLFNPFSIAQQPNHSWNNMLNIFQFKQPDREPYTNPYSAILYGYCTDDVYNQWYKLEITTQIKLQNSSETLPLRMIFELCEKMV